MAPEVLMKKNDKIRLKKYARTIGLLALGMGLGFSTAHLSLVSPQKAVAESPKMVVTQVHNNAAAKPAEKSRAKSSEKKAQLKSEKKKSVAKSKSSKKKAKKDAKNKKSSKKKRA